MSSRPNNKELSTVRYVGVTRVESQSFTKIETVGHHALPMFRSDPIRSAPIGPNMSDCPASKKRRTTKELTPFQRFSFYTQSKAREPVLANDPNWRRYLSNFQLLDGVTLSFQDLIETKKFLTDIGAEEGEDYSEYKDMEFRSIEHAFQAAKYAFASTTDGSGVKAWLGAYSLSEDGVSCSSALDAKRKGGKGGFKTAGCSLNIQKWITIRVPIMRSLVKQRVLKDAKYRSIIASLVDGGHPVVHFERGSKDKPPFWGQVQLKDSGDIVGENMLGKLMMETIC